MSRAAAPGSDRRPRIHLWPGAGGASFSFGPCGARVAARSVGEAVEMAVDAIERRAAVIIFEGGNDVRS